ncbi:MFSD10 [Bugula neritina]|uniref:MFSD10 n=1 Tax=Bugula neritina TaxID=10212 RepID=A0A7J7J2A9_BUGNE|nr:MFSD10 [Bugula neritina]
MAEYQRNNEKIIEEKNKISTAKMNVVIFMTLLIDLLGFTVILPLMPKLLEFYGKEGSDDLYSTMKSSVSSFRILVGAPDTPKWNSVLFGGVIGSLFSLLQFLASPFIGAASDVYGRRPMMLLTMVGVALSYVIWVFAGNFSLFVLSRVVGGLAKGNVSLSTAVVADVYNTKQRGQGMAMIGISFSMGFLLGPIIGAGFAGGVVPGIGSGEFFVGPALFALSMALLDIVYIFCAFQETLPENKRLDSMFAAGSRMFDLINPLALFSFKNVSGVKVEERRSMRKIGLIYFIYLFLYSGIEFTLTFLTYLRFNYSSMQQGKMFFTLGLVMIFIQGGYTRRKASGTEKKTALSGILVLMPAFLCIGYAKSAVLFYLGLLLFGFASATVVPCMTTIISEYGADSQKGSVLGVFRALGALARAMGPLSASAAYWSLGAETCYVLGAVLMLVPFTMLMFTRVRAVDRKE